MKHKIIKFQQRTSRKGYLVPGSSKMFVTEDQMKLNTIETNLILSKI